MIKIENGEILNYLIQIVGKGRFFSSLKIENIGTEVPTHSQLYQKSGRKIRIIFDKEKQTQAFKPFFLFLSQKGVIHLFFRC